MTDTQTNTKTEIRIFRLIERIGQRADYLKTLSNSDKEIGARFSGFTFISPKFLDIWNPWGKVMERSGLKFEHFSSTIV